MIRVIGNLLYGAKLVDDERTIVLEEQDCSSTV